MITKYKYLLCCWTACLPILGLAAVGNDLRVVEATKNQDWAAVRSLIKQHVNVNASEGDGATALLWAVHWDNMETVELLLDAGANVNSADDLGTTPLSMACTNSDTAMVERLLKGGAKPNMLKTPLDTGETALMTCAKAGAVSAVKALLAQGADVEARENRLGQTALMWSAANKHPEVTRMLIENGANVNAQSKSGFTPLLFAARNNDMESARMLVAAGADVNHVTTGGMTPLFMASASGHEALAIFLAENGANPNVADRNGMTPLDLAMQKGVSALRAAGTGDPFTYDFFWRPNMGELVKVLLKHGANPNASFVERPSDLEGSGHISWLSGVTPFVLAVATLDTDSMRVLAASGADTRVRAGNGMTPLMLVINARPEGTPAVATKKALDVLAAVLDLGGDVNADDQDGQTALHLAVSKGSDPIVHFLVDNGAKVDARDAAGQTALHIAAFKGADRIVQYLVDKGAELNAKNASGQTPLDVAESSFRASDAPKAQGSIEILLRDGKKYNKSTADLLTKLGGERNNTAERDPNAPPLTPVAAVGPKGE